MGEAGRARAITHFSAEAGDRALAAARAAIIPGTAEESPSVAGSPT